MSSELAIKVESLNKSYRIYEQPIDRLMQFVTTRLSSIFGSQNKNYYREFWALNNVSFEIKKGETVGIVGRNGSGKSTLLQIICGTLSQTSGKIITHGRIAALLELGSGFNPEFTGRENVYLNATILGLSKSEIDARFDEITSFADIGEFIEQPVKTYSSGMTVRLAFSVAISVNPDILVVDEALSVGDELFQRKCFSRIETIRSAGATILFVSHSGGAIVELCDRALLLDNGERLAVGIPKKIIGCYQKLLYAPQEKRGAIRKEIRKEDEHSIDTQSTPREFDILTSEVLQKTRQQLSANSELPDSYDPSLEPKSTISYESHGAIIQDPALYTLDGERVNNISRGKSYYYRYRVNFDSSASNIRFGMLIKTTTGFELGGATSASSYRSSLPFVITGTSFLVEFSFTCRLNPGIYFLNAGVVGDLNGSETYLHRLIDVAAFRVMSETESLATGVVDFNCIPLIDCGESIGQ